MEDKPKKSPHSLIVYFILGLFFALLSIFVKRLVQISYERMGAAVGIDKRWLFWLFLVLSMVCILPLVVAIFRNLHEQKKLPKFFEPFFQQDVRSEQDRLSWKIRSWLFGRIGLLIVTGSAILLLCIFIARANVIDDDAINGPLYELVRRLQGIEPAELNFSYVSELVYLTASKDTERHMRDLLSIVYRLKAAGAKAVLITLPQFPPEGRNALQLVKEIEKSGIVVWGYNPSSSNTAAAFGFADSLGEPKPMLQPCDEEAEHLWKSPVLARLWPGEIPLVLLGKYHDYQRFLHTYAQFGDEIEFGEHKIALSKGKWSYTLDRYEGSRSLDIYVQQGDPWTIGGAVWGGTPKRSHHPFVHHLGFVNATDTLQYSILKKRSAAESSWSPLEKSAFDERIKNRIVLLAGNYGAEYGYYVPDRAHAVWLESVLRGDLMKKPASGYFWLSLTCLVIAGLFAYRFRPLVTILLLFVLAAGTLVFASYLYASSNIIIDIFYPLLCIGIAMIVFPAVVLARRVGGESAEIELSRG